MYVITCFIDIKMRADLASQGCVHVQKMYPISSSSGIFADSAVVWQTQVECVQQARPDGVLFRHYHGNGDRGIRKFALVLDQMQYGNIFWNFLLMPIFRVIHQKFKFSPLILQFCSLQKFSNIGDYIANISVWPKQRKIRHKEESHVVSCVIITFFQHFPFLFVQPFDTYDKYNRLLMVEVLGRGCGSGTILLDWKNWY